MHAIQCKCDPREPFQQAAAAMVQVVDDFWYAAVVSGGERNRFSEPYDAESQLK